jgi:hypothetical protein
MAAARTSVRGLSADEVQAIRDGLDTGRRPRVVFTASAGQIAGQVGQVVSLLDPAESDEWVVVRFGRDELPFSPGDLQVAPKGAVARKSVAPTPGPVVAVRPEPEFVIDKPVPGNGASRSGATSAARRAEPAGGVAQAPGQRKAAGDGVPATAQRNGATAQRNGASAQRNGASEGGPATATTSVPAPAPRRAAVRVGKAKGTAGLTVTLAYADGEWTVAAAQGAKALAKPYVIRPAEALRMVSLVDVPGVQEAVEQIVAAERAEAEQQAERLRAELAEIEARLAELRDAG